MNTVYIYIVLGHKSLFTGKIAIVGLPSTYMFIDTYKEEAKKKACEEFGLNKDEVSILDFMYLGEEVAFI